MKDQKITPSNKKVHARWHFEKLTEEQAEQENKLFEIAAISTLIESYREIMMHDKKIRQRCLKYFDETDYAALLKKYIELSEREGFKNDPLYKSYKYDLEYKTVTTLESQK